MVSYRNSVREGSNSDCYTRRTRDIPVCAALRGVGEGLSHHQERGDSNEVTFEHFREPSRLSALALAALPLRVLLPLPAAPTLATIPPLQTAARPIPRRAPIPLPLPRSTRTPSTAFWPLAMLQMTPRFPGAPGPRRSRTLASSVWVASRPPRSLPRSTRRTTSSAALTPVLRSCSSATSWVTSPSTSSPR